jgi:hypothetical protein
MERWHETARPYVERVIRAEEALVDVSEGTAVLVHASCDQLTAAVTDLQLWLQSHRCPDGEYAAYVADLQSAGVGLCVIMQLVVREAPDGRWIGNHDLVERVATNLMDRIEQADRARIYLQGWGDRDKQPG